MADVSSVRDAVAGGRRRRERVDGVLLLDKPYALSSNHAMLAARRLLNAEKAGHGGTLDPLASGLLPIVFGEATKFAHDLLDADKTYVATLRLGVATDSGDAEGSVISERPVDCDADRVRGVLAGFLGSQLQVPPMQSALKRDGRPLYELARAGIVVERAPRAVTIHALEMLALEPAQLVLRVRCSKGTYVRTLAADIGERLGCGAHLSGLRREAVGALSLEHAITLAALEASSAQARVACLLPLDALLAGLPAMTLDDAEARRFGHGQRLRLAMGAVAGAAPGTEPNAEVRVYGQGRLLGVGRFDDGLLIPVRLIAATQTTNNDDRDGGRTNE